MAAKVKRCARCDRRMRNGVEWACGMDIDEEGLGTVAEFYCPDCTTAAEHTQREINDATTTYVWYGDRVARFPKYQETALN
jgi:hypothetical protein